MTIQIVLDFRNGILHVNNENSVFKKQIEWEEDPFILIKYNDLGSICGLVILDVYSFVPIWHKHPIRQIIPSDILTELDLWFFSAENLSIVETVEE